MESLKIDDDPVEYSPLDTSRSEIRLISFVHEPEDDGTVRCKLRKVSLDDEDLDYVTLSYVWGDPTITRPITVDGKVFHATTNLVEVLTQISNVPFSLWIDAICINQRNILERNSQVGLMAQIYSQG